MAAVYLASLQGDQGFHKWVALKLGHPHLVARDAKFKQMFVDEARLAARIDHPNVCAVFDSGEHEGRPFLAMEYLHGETLAAVLKKKSPAGPLGMAEALRIVIDAARGLHAAHELRRSDGTPAGVVHRDVSPQNLFVLYSGVTKVVDFGIARCLDHLGEATRTGELKGKLAYLAPEQLRHHPVDRRTDLWALGVVLWEALAHARLFARPDLEDTLRAILHEPIPRLDARTERIPRPVADIVARCLDRDPAARFATLQELARALEQHLVTSGVVCSVDDVAEAMQGRFAEQIAQREARLAEAQAAPQLDVALEAPEALAPPRVEAPQTARSPRRFDRWTVALWGIALAGFGGTAAMLRWPAMAPVPRVGRSIPPPEPWHEAPPLAPSVPTPAPPALPAPPAPAPALPAPAPLAPVPSARGGRSRVAAGLLRDGGRTSDDTAPSARAPVGDGYLTLVANVPTEVRLGGRLLGETPLRDLALPAGRHTLSLQVTASPTVRDTLVVELQPHQSLLRTVRWEVSP